jgi:serine protease Do
MKMRNCGFAVVVSFLMCAVAAGEQDRRPYVNDKKAPENRKDLEAIQSALTASLPVARAATVCIDLGEGSGSGVIVSADGLVLTAAHVSTAVKKKLTVILEDGTKLNARSLGLVASSDAAMVQILDEGPFPFVEVDRADSTRLGDWVFALGHSGGFDKERGSVVRLGRLVRTASTTLQSDCMLIGGDSGGPLFDLSGRLIGIHSRVGQQLQVNMHVPVREFLNHWDGMLASEFIGEGPFASKPEPGTGYLGLGTEADPEGGLRVTKVGEDSPAEKAGVEEGDRVVRLNGTDLESREQLQEIMKELAPGDEIELGIQRDGEAQTLTFELGAR